MAVCDPPLTDAQLALLERLLRGPLHPEDAERVACAEQIAELKEAGWIADTASMLCFCVADRVADKLADTAQRELHEPFADDARELRQGRRIAGYRIAVDAFHGACDELLGWPQRDRRDQVAVLLFTDRPLRDG